MHHPPQMWGQPTTLHTLILKITSTQHNLQKLKFMKIKHIIIFWIFKCLVDF